MNTVETQARCQRLRRARLQMVLIAELLVFAGLLQRSVWDQYRVEFNWTDSLPGYLYLIRLGELPSRRGELIEFRAPKNHFYREGEKFVKVARGMPGDLVRRKGRNFFVNEQFVGQYIDVSPSGLPLLPGPTGVVPADHFWVWTPHPYSLDSRYADIGLIGRDRIVGVAQRLL